MAFFLLQTYQNSFNLKYFMVWNWRDLIWNTLRCYCSDFICYVFSHHFYRNLGRIKASGNRLIWLSQINDPGLRNFDHLQLMRLMLVVMDAWILDEENLADADLIVMDAKDISLRMLTKMNLSVARKMAKYQEVRTGVTLNPSERLPFMIIIIITVHQVLPELSASIAFLRPSRCSILLADTAFSGPWILFELTVSFFVTKMIPGWGTRARTKLLPFLSHFV